MTPKPTFFAADLGATSGRTILATIDNGKIVMQELTRFANPLIETGGHYYWDIFHLYNEIIGGLKVAAQQGADITSIGVDTWGVDFVAIGPDGALLRNPLAYRDPHTFEAMDHYLAHQASREEVYETTGIQLMNFNSLFQLHAMRREQNSALAAARRILFMPDALAYMLTGEEVCEYTIASTSQMLDPRTKELDAKLLRSVGLCREMFGRMVMPGTPIGTLTPDIQRMTGLGAIPVVAVAGHDTGSAVAAVPAHDRHFAYLSSGTWSLMGIETPEAIINARSYELNFTNEGGIEGTTRFLKNICGMWLYERCRKEWSLSLGTSQQGASSQPADSSLSHAALQAEAMQSEAFRSIINPDDKMFANPPKMVEAIQQYCRQTGQPVPTSRGEVVRCIFDSLALRYRQVFGWLREFYAEGQGGEAAGGKLDVLHIIGGGSLNKNMNQMTADACGVTVLAGPQECTALGNVMMQAKAMHLVDDIWAMRRLIADSVDIERYEPAGDEEAWREAFARFLVMSNE